MKRHRWYNRACSDIQDMGAWYISLCDSILCEPILCLSPESTKHYIIPSTDSYPATGSLWLQRSQLNRSESHSQSGRFHWTRPFNMKEHVLITMFANSGSGGVYAVNIITNVMAFHRRSLNPGAAFLLSQTTQVGLVFLLSIQFVNHSDWTKRPSQLVPGGHTPENVKTKKNYPPSPQPHWVRHSLMALVSNLRTFFHHWEFLFFIPLIQLYHIHHHFCILVCVDIVLLILQHSIN